MFIAEATVVPNLPSWMISVEMVQMYPLVGRECLCGITAEAPPPDPVSSWPITHSCMVMTSSQQYWNYWCNGRMTGFTLQKDTFGKQTYSREWVCMSVCMFGQFL